MTRQLGGGLLVALSAAICAAASPATRKAMPAPAERQLTDVKLEQIALSDVLDFYRDVSGANFVINWDAIEKAGVRRSTPVSYEGHNVKFQEALEKSVAAAGKNLVIDHTHRAFFITSKDDPAKLNNVMPFALRGAAEAKEPAGLNKHMGQLKLEGSAWTTFWIWCARTLTWSSMWNGMRSRLPVLIEQRKWISSFVT